MSAIHIGVGGWDYDPWRESFYPPGLPKTRQLEYLGQHLTATEVNATFYKLQKPETFARWRDMVPERFKFAIKASRFCTNRKDLGTAGEGIGKFCAQGFTELGDKLGPILWQLAPTKAFDPDEIRDFLSLLPTSRDGIALRHVLEVRHESFRCREFVAILRAAGVAIAIADHETHPQIADLSADLVYARLQSSRETAPTGYSPAALDRWVKVARGWTRGESPEELDYVTTNRPATVPRETFVFFISGAKVHNPAAAMALLERLH